VTKEGRTLEWILLIVLSFAVLYFVFNGEDTTTSRRQSRAVAIKDFIDNKKTYQPQEAVQTIHDFIVALGDTEDHQYSAVAEDVASTFRKLLQKVKHEYQDLVRDFEKDLADSTAHYANQIDEVKANENLDKEEKKEEIADLKADLKEELKRPKKAIKWCERQISGIEENPRQILKKTLSHIKRVHLDDSPLLNLDDDICLWMEVVKEPPL
tara:strand:- start:218 stop:850 length:633 start_codon:yes stop_codon:yes gene_type:complete